MKSITYIKPRVRDYIEISKLRNVVRNITHGTNNNFIEPDIKRNSIYDSNHYWLIAKTDGKIVGYTHSHLLSNNEAIIVSLFVLPDFQGFGIGTKLINLSMSWFRRRKVKMVRLRVVESNRNAINFYKRNLFAENKSIESKKGEIFMIKLLNKK